MLKIYLRNLFILPVIMIIKAYQLIISPILKNNCRYLPTCSEYSILAFKEHGLLIGFYYSTNDKILIIIIIIFILSAIISGYHFGIENSFFDELSSCTNNSLDLSDKKKLLESLNKNMPISCKDATFKVLGLSLAAINTLLSILIVIISVRTLTYEKN